MVRLVNLSKDEPFKDRAGHVFPPQMLPYSEKMELARVTITQLSGLYLGFKNNEVKVKNISITLAYLRKTSI